MKLKKNTLIEKKSEKKNKKAKHYFNKIMFGEQGFSKTPINPILKMKQEKEKLIKKKKT